jgi:hypothetical protein
VTGSFVAMMRGGPVDLLKAPELSRESIDHTEVFVANLGKKFIDPTDWLPRLENPRK